MEVRLGMYVPKSTFDLTQMGFNHSTRGCALHAAKGGEAFTEGRLMQLSVCIKQ